jgi:hypothetical protein
MRNWSRWGLVVRQSSDGKIITFGPNAAAFPPGSVNVSVHKWTSATVFSATYSGSEIPIYGLVHWLRFTDNGTNRIFYHSHDGQTWVQHHSVGRTDFLTADQVGFFVSDYTTSVAMGGCAHLLSWTES